MNKIIAAVKSISDIKLAADSKIDIIFWLAPNINTMPEVIKLVHNENKKLYIHMDMAEGLGKDKFGIKYVKDLGVDGIVSTRGNIIKYAKEAKMSTVQRFFAIDAQSIETIIETIKNTKPEMIEIMPGILPKVIDKLNKVTETPIIAGGLVETENEALTTIKSGAIAISTGNKKLWHC